MADPYHARRFEELALPHLDAAYNLARWLTGSEHDANDVVQEAYLRAFKFFDGFRGTEARSWLLTIVRHTCYTWLQQNRPRPNAAPFDELLEAETASADDGPETLLLRQHDRALLNRALERLPTEFREVLVLKELEDLSYREIAAITGVPLGTVMSRLSRARKLLCKNVQSCVREA